MSSPQDKIVNIKQTLNCFLTRTLCIVREFAKLIGKLVASCPATKFGNKHIKPFETIKYLSLKNNIKDYNKRMDILGVIKPEHTWWLNNIGKGQDKKPQHFSLEIYSDASPSGWGASRGEINCHGFWDNIEKIMHVNYLEIKSAYYALKSISKNKQHTSVLIRIDNQTAISYINRGGSVKNKQLNEVCSKLWDWCEEKDIMVFASYVPSANNTKADTESRFKSIDTEYELNDSVSENFRNIW